MKITTLFIAICFVLCSCKHQEKQEKISDVEAVMQQTPAKEKTCYAYSKDGNIVKLSMYINDDKKASGSLFISYKEKDANEGILTGNIHQDTLLINYKFKAEGRTSQRDMIFLFKGDQLIEGYGPMNPDGASFEDISKVKFTSKMPLTKVNCRDQ